MSQQGLASDDDVIVHNITIAASANMGKWSEVGEEEKKKEEEEEGRLW